ncbi:hypothetical protein RFI_22685, partial [Reticulomyxa filosa]
TQTCVYVYVYVYIYFFFFLKKKGNVEFWSEATTTLRVSDGVLIVVDCVQGIRMQTETLLRQAISERVRPVLFLNKLDCVFSELHSSLEDCYQICANIIEAVNVICQTYEDQNLGNIEVQKKNGHGKVLPHTERVAFGSGLQGWGFTLRDFSRLYASKFGLPTKKMLNMLWGDHYWDPLAKKWVTQNSGMYTSYFRLMNKKKKM